MEDRDKIQALWLNLAIIMNALEELGEDIHAVDGTHVYGNNAQVGWDSGAGRWEVTTL